MANPGFEMLVENLRREQERFRQERESRHYAFVRRMDTLRERHDHLVTGRIRRLSLDGIAVDIDTIKQRSREYTMVDSGKAASVDVLKMHDKNKATTTTNTYSALGCGYKMKKELCFDCRYPRKVTVCHNETASAPQLKVPPQPRFERGKTHPGFTAKQNFRRIGNKVNNVIRLSSNKRHNVASSSLHQTPGHGNIVRDQLETLQLYKAHTQISFEESVKRESHYLNTASLPNTSRIPKLAIGRTMFTRPITPPSSPKQRLQSALRKLECARRFQINV